MPFYYLKDAPSSIAINPALWEAQTFDTTSKVLEFLIEFREWFESVCKEDEYVVWDLNIDMVKPELRYYFSNQRTSMMFALLGLKL